MITEKNRLKKTLLKNCVACSGKKGSVISTQDSERQSSTHSRVPRWSLPVKSVSAS